MNQKAPSRKARAMARRYLANLNRQEVATMIKLILSVVPILLALTMVSCHGAIASEMNSPIKNFHVVETGIYRGARPSDDDLKWLASIGVKTIINLENDDDAIVHEEKVAIGLGITESVHEMSGFFAPEDVELMTIESYVASLRPVFIHCKLGEDRTGLVVALHRVWHDGWKAESAYKEMYRDGHDPLLFPLDIDFWRLESKRP
jgi:hypothetical protein